MIDNGNHRKKNKTQGIKTAEASISTTSVDFVYHLKYGMLNF